MRRAWLVAAFGLLIAGCATAPPERDGAPEAPPDLGAVPDAVPQDEPRAEYGNPDSYVVFGERYHVMDSAAGYRERGYASWYGSKFHGRLTSTRETYDMYAMTAAHRELPLPSYVEVTNLANGKRVVVRVNDRGPFVDTDRRIIDLSYAAAHRLDMVEAGTAPVEVRVVGPGHEPPAPEPRRARSADEAPSIADAERAARAAGNVAAGGAPGPAAPGGADLLEPMAFDIQVGAFGEAANARSLKAEVADALGLPVRVDAADGYHRVRVGPLDGLGAVDRALEALGELGLDGRLIRP